MKNICITLIIGFLFSVISVNGQFSPPNREEVRLTTVKRETKALYRKPSDEEESVIAPNPQLRMKYSDFLRQPDTGLIKLVPDQGCGENTKILVVSEACMKYTMPGGGSSYSFRKETYRIWRLSDLLYKDGILHAIGVRSQGILLKLGDVPLENVSLKTNGVKFLTDFDPATEFEDAKMQNRELLEGVTEGEFYYRKALTAVENYTYVLRSVAYRGKFYKAVKGVVYNELDYDKRRDVIIAFRIVQQNTSDGSITILWKELANNKSPKLNVEKESENEDF